VRFYGTVALADPGGQVGFQLLRPGKSMHEGGSVVIRSAPRCSPLDFVGKPGVRLVHVEHGNPGAAGADIY
jgi:hypothetical protein